MKKIKKNKLEKYQNSGPVKDQSFIPSINNIFQQGLGIAPNITNPGGNPFGTSIFGDQLTKGVFDTAQLFKGTQQLNQLETPLGAWGGDVSKGIEKSILDEDMKKYKADNFFNSAKAWADESGQTFSEPSKMFGAYQKSIQDRAGQQYDNTIAAQKTWNEYGKPLAGNMAAMNSLTDMQAVEGLKGNKGALYDVTDEMKGMESKGIFQMGGAPQISALQQALGYKDSSPFKKLPSQTILRNTSADGVNITMDGVSKNLYLIPDKGRPVLAQGNSGEYYFPNANAVEEIPAMEDGGMPDRYKEMGFSSVNTPKRTPGASKSHAVVIKDDGDYKLIRFGQQGVSGSPKKEGESEADENRRASFKARHAANIAKGKTSAAYWANKVKWEEGGQIPGFQNSGAITRQLPTSEELYSKYTQFTEKYREESEKRRQAILDKLMQDGLPLEKAEIFIDRLIENMPADKEKLSGWKLDKGTIEDIKQNTGYFAPNAIDIIKPYIDLESAYLNQREMHSMIADEVQDLEAGITKKQTPAPKKKFIYFQDGGATLQTLNKYPFLKDVKIGYNMDFDGADKTKIKNKDYVSSYIAAKDNPNIFSDAYLTGALQTRIKLLESNGGDYQDPDVLAIDALIDRAKFEAGKVNNPKKMGQGGIPILNLSKNINYKRLNPQGIYKMGGLITEGSEYNKRKQPKKNSISGASSTGPMGPKDIPSYDGGIRAIIDQEKNEIISTENLIPIQTEKGELIVLPTGDVVPVMAKKRHHQMDEDEVTDVAPEGAYILSSFGRVKIKKKEAENVIAETGVKPYKLGIGQETPTEKTLGDIMTKKEMAPAEVGKIISRRFPVIATDNPYEAAANTENKINRRPYLEGLIQLSEFDKMRKGIDTSTPEATREYRDEEEMYEYEGGENEMEGAEVEEMMQGGNPMFRRNIPHALDPITIAALIQAGSGIVQSVSSMVGSAQQRKAADQAYRDVLRMSNQSADRQRGQLGLGAAAGILGTLSQDPTVNAAYLNPTYINQMQTRTPSQITDSIANSAFANMPTFSNLAPQQQMLASQAAWGQALKAAGDARMNAWAGDRTARNQQLQSLQQYYDTNENNRVAAQNATRLNRNQQIGNVGDRTQGYFDSTATIEANLGQTQANARLGQGAAQQQAIRSYTQGINQAIGTAGAAAYDLYANKKPTTGTTTGTNIPADTGCWKVDQMGRRTPIPC